MLLPKDPLFRIMFILFIFPSSGVKSCFVVVKRLPVIHFSIVYISMLILDHCAHRDYLKIAHTTFVQRRINVDATYDVASALMRRCINVMSPLGTISQHKARRH